MHFNFTTASIAMINHVFIFFSIVQIYDISYVPLIKVIKVHSIYMYCTFPENCCMTKKKSNNFNQFLFALILPDKVTSLYLPTLTHYARVSRLQI